MNKSHKILLDYTAHGLKNAAESTNELHIMLNNTNRYMEGLAEEIRVLKSVTAGEMTITPKKGANRRPRTEAEKAQQAQIKKDWWAKKKAQEKKTPTPEQATSEGKPS
jgi:hypothetical protein